MSTGTRFWKALDALPGLAAVGPEWRALLGEEFDLARPFLQPRPRRATSYPRLNAPGLPYRVVEHGPDDLVAVCDETGDTIPLTAADLVVHEVDRARLAGRVADAFELARDGPPEHWDERVVRLGHGATASTKYAFFLAFPGESTDVHAVSAGLIADGQHPFILTCPTRQWLRRAADTVLRANGCVFVSLAESVALCGGRLHMVEPLDRLVSRWTAAAGAASAESREAAVRSVLRRDDDIWTATFLGKTAPLKDSLGLRAIAHLISNKGRHIGAVLLKALATGNVPLRPAAGIEVADSAAQREWKSEYDGLLDQLEEAQRNNDVVRQERLQTQVHALEQHVLGARGLGGRTRKTKDHTENARIALTNALSRAIDKIQGKHSHLARHLDTSIERGRFFRYLPVPNVDWDLG